MCGVCGVLVCESETVELPVQFMQKCHCSKRYSLFGSLRILAINTVLVFSPPPLSHPISAAFLTQTVNLDDTTVKFEIWDTAGQERYHSLAPMYYRGAQAAIVVYDITNQVREGVGGGRGGGGMRGGEEGGVGRREGGGGGRGGKGESDREEGGSNGKERGVGEEGGSDGEDGE